MKTTSTERKSDDGANSESDYEDNEDNEWDDDGWGEEKVGWGDDMFHVYIS